jgi:hypothetical protein
MANTYHDQLTGTDLHDNKVYPATMTELSAASQALYNARYAAYTHTHPDTELSSLATLNARFAYKTIRTVAPSTMNADYLTDGTGDDTQINQAINAVSANGGGAVLLLNRPTGSYDLATPIVAKDNVDIISNGATVTSSMGSSGAQGMINVSARTNVEILGVAFNLSSGLCTAITSYGHDGLRIRRCKFSGTAALDSVINFEGNAGSASFIDALIEGCRFVALPNIARCIKPYARNGHIVDGLAVNANYFKGSRGPCVFLDCYDTIRNIALAGNTTIDTIDGGTPSSPPNLLQTRISAGGAYYISDVTVDRNYYRNTLTSNTQQGLVYYYECKDVRITNNTAIGAWTTATNIPGPAIAPGRTTYPDLHTVIADNYIRGFDAAWDPDAMRFMDCHDNIVEQCGSAFGLGYSVQEYVKIHDNIFYNCFGLPSTPYKCFIFCANATSTKKCEIYNNTYIDDTAAPQNIWAIELTGNYNYSDVSIHDNNIYMPNGTITEYVHRELGSEVYPRTIYDNEIHDATGVTREFKLSLGNKTGVFTINPAAGAIQSATLTGNVTPTISTGTYKGQIFDLELTQDATGNRTCAKPVNSKVPGGTLPISTAANARDCYRFRWDGSAWLLAGYQLNLS